MRQAALTKMLQPGYCHPALLPVRLLPWKEQKGLCWQSVPEDLSSCGSESEAGWELAEQNA